MSVSIYPKNTAIEQLGSCMLSKCSTHLYTRLLMCWAQKCTLKAAVDIGHLYQTAVGTTFGNYSVQLLPSAHLPQGRDVRIDFDVYRLIKPQTMFVP